MLWSACAVSADLPSKLYITGTAIEMWLLVPFLIPIVHYDQINRIISFNL